MSALRLNVRWYASSAL